MTIYDQMAARIIKEQELLMGPVAWSEASKVAGLGVVDKQKGVVQIKGNGGQVLDKLVDRYGSLFGRAGREVCKEAVSAIITDLQPSQIPVSLK